MCEFTFMEDWDLQAVVRGGSSCCSEAFANIMINDNNPQTYLSSSLSSILDHDDDLSMGFPELFESSAARDFHHHGQKGMYQPVYPSLQQQPQALSPPSVLRTASSVSIPCCDVKEPENIRKKCHLSLSDIPVISSDDIASMETRSKRRRKNQQKRMVKHVEADGRSYDMWAWRKYGQKSIKGSPYPRSYYRCSSLKGCLARKQVERSNSDPSTFMITYTAEHSHPPPTRKNSLAGSTRMKSSMAKEAKSDEPNTPTIKFKDEYSNAAILSSTTHSSMASTMEDGQLRQHIKDEEEDILEDGISDEERAMPDIIFSEDLFPSLEDFEGLFLDHGFSGPVP